MANWGRRGAIVAAGLVIVALPAAPATAAEPARIAEIQGSTRISPLVDQSVTDVPGVVTAVRAFGAARGFWFQDPEPDGDPRTSEGLFVFTGERTPELRVGDSVAVSGQVTEYYPGEPEDALQSVTQLTDARWTVSARNVPLPAAETLRPHTVPESYAPEPGGSIEQLPLRPDRYALDYYESREGMRLRVADARVVGPTTQYDEFYLTSKPKQQPSARGGTVYTGYDEPNSGRLKITSLLPFAEHPFPRVNVADRIAGQTVGPLDYDQFGGYTLRATELGQPVSGGLTRERAKPQLPGELSVATYNVENLSAQDDQARFDDLARGITANLARPDIVALEEIQDDTGPADDGVVAADETLRKFTRAIAAAGGPEYKWRQIDPEDKADGGQPGGNIRVAFLYNPARVSFVDRPGGDATTATRVHTERGKPVLSHSPGRIDPGHPAWADTRKPLAGEFRFGGRTVFVVANHFSSKGGDQPMHGRIQPPERVSEQARVQQAAVVREFTEEILAVNPRANVVVAGDLNDFQFSDTLGELTGGGLRALVDELPENERYGYVFEGNSQVLDHMLVSAAPRRVSYDVVHVNAEFTEQTSDHDPQLLRMRPVGR
ncbi:hypothetical protein EV191_101942 [Tamaricihabitans halophyticus]|uniref:Endonuclease/exonuclease/phosphatase domain-containing protein n=1 Tax=Tamaricihabitans halophyticus TaxID=1262583 RepID=A0A4R2R2L9_9PSEU|nr:endonuclease/exonuclease/phosphatase family protein [Tamaricihabitans halophyticus]TCP56992.1 hypothetical protein EV191_101942 [Tamaricihabitans halophyticus]